MSLARPHPHAASLKVETLISEIAGSESFIHVEFSGVRWVMLEHGVHAIEPGISIDVHLDTRHLMAFAADGRAIDGASRAANDRAA